LPLTQQAIPEPSSRRTKASSLTPLRPQRAVDRERHGRTPLSEAARSRQAETSVAGMGAPTASSYPPYLDAAYDDLVRSKELEAVDTAQALDKKTGEAFGFRSLFRCRRA